MSPRDQPQHGLKMTVSELPYLREGCSTQVVVTVQGANTPQVLRLTLPPDGGVCFVHQSAPTDANMSHDPRFKRVVTCASFHDLGDGDFIAHSESVTLVAIRDARIHLCVTPVEADVTAKSFDGQKAPQPVRPTPDTSSGPQLELVKNGEIEDPPEEGLRDHPTLIPADDPPLTAEAHWDGRMEDEEELPPGVTRRADGVLMSPPMILEEPDEEEADDDASYLDDEETERPEPAPKPAASMPPSSPPPGDEEAAEEASATTATPPLEMPVPSLPGSAPTRVVRPVDVQPEPRTGTCPPPSDDQSPPESRLARVFPGPPRTPTFPKPTPQRQESPLRLLGAVAFLALGLIVACSLAFNFPFSWRSPFRQLVGVDHPTAMATLIAEPTADPPSVDPLPVEPTHQVEQVPEVELLITPKQKDSEVVARSPSGDMEVILEDAAVEAVPIPPEPPPAEVVVAEEPAEVTPVYVQRTCTWITGGLLSKVPDPDGCVIVGCAEGHAIAMLNTDNGWEYCERYPTESADGSCVQVLTEPGTPTTVQFDPETKTWPTYGRCSVDR